MRLVVALVFAFVHLHGQAKNTLDETPWILSFSIRDEAQSNTLPVLLLGKNTWSAHLGTVPSTAHAWRSLQIDSQAIHRSGWSLGYLWRAEAQLSASPDAVKMAALLNQKTDPATASQYSVFAQQKNWQGKGLQVGLPALQISPQTQLNLHWQWLELSRYDTGQIQGAINYLGTGDYAFDLASTRTGAHIQSPFTDVADAHGWGSAFGLSLRTRPHPRLYANLQALDLVSTLRWRTGHEQSVLTSNVQSRDAQGYLNYAAAVSGQREIRPWVDRMTQDWRMDVSWKWQTNASSTTPGYVTFEARRKASLQQYWLGWSAQPLQPTSTDALSWRVAMAPTSRAWMTAIHHQGWHVMWCADSLNESAKLRTIYAGWRMNLS